MSTSNNNSTISGITGIVRKLITGFTGLFLILFVIIHLLGNLTLFKSSGDSFNYYAHFLESQGLLLYLAEIGLVLTFLFHAVAGIQVYLGKKRARPENYVKYESAGGKSKQTLASRSMIFTGIVLLLFVFVHVATLKFNVHLSANEVPTTVVDGEEMRDLYQIVYDTFSNPIAAFGYTFVMILLGFHLRHGFWSALQSLGAMKPKYSPVIHTVGLFIAIALAVGFLAIPLYIFFTTGGAA